MHATDLKSQQGGLLFSFLFILVFLASLWLIAATLVVNETRVRVYDAQQSRALYAAESGIEYARSILSDSASWRAGLAQTDMGSGTFSVQIDDKTTIPALDDTIKITSIGTSGDMIRKIVVKMIEPKIILLVVPNSASPSSQDLARKNQFEAWGYSVKLISDNAPASEFNQATQSTFVVYIVEDCWAFDINTKLTDNPISIISEENNLSDDLKLTNSDMWFNLPWFSINLKINTHYITNTFSLGYLQICTSWTSLPFAPFWVHTAPGVQKMARLGPWSLLFNFLVIDTGQQLYDGSASPGKRVMLPFGGSSFNFNKLNANGLTILQRSIEWCLNGASVAELERPRYLSWEEEY